MGYTTEFQGQLAISPPLTVPALTFLQGLLGEDMRDHQLCREWQDATTNGSW